MFVELMPLLAGRTVRITVAKVDDKTLRVNVIPALAKADDNPALSTPLTYTGPPEELDAELGKHLAGYVQTHQQTASTLAFLGRLFRNGEISYHGGFINLARGATSLLRIDPLCWKRTRRLNKRTTPLRRRQEEGSNGRANQGRVAGPDRRA